MLFNTYISQLRTQVGDTPERKHIDWIGDGATTAFQMPLDTFPVLDQTATYSVKVNNALQTEITNYTLDKETGLLTMLAAPGNGISVTVDCFRVYLTDASWLLIVNNVTKSLGNDFFKEFVDTTNFTSTINMVSLPLTAFQPNCIAVYDFFYKPSINTDWTVIEEIGNWRYDSDNNVIYIGSRDSFSSTGLSLKIRGLKTFTLGVAVTDTVDVQDRYMTVIEYGAIARYWRYRYKSVVELVSKMTTEQSRTPLHELMMLSDRFDRAYEAEKAKLKPMKPVRIIPPFLVGGGRP